MWEKLTALKWNKSLVNWKVIFLHEPPTFYPLADRGHTFGKLLRLGSKNFHLHAVVDTFPFNK